MDYSLSSKNDDIYETVHEVVDSQIDPTTGAVLTSNSVATKTTQVVHKAEPQYVKLYIKDMLYMRDMPKGLSDITLALASRATYADSSNIDQGLRVALTPYIKEEICRECGYTNVRSLNNDLTKLVKGCIIKKILSLFKQLGITMILREKHSTLFFLTMTKKTNPVVIKY